MLPKIIANFLSGLKNYSEPVKPNFRPVGGIVPASWYDNCKPWKGIVLHHCLHGDSLVLTPDGPVCIKDIKTGDTVYCLDPKNNIVRSKVLNKWHKGVNQLYRIITNTRTILATSEHPLLSLIKPGKKGGNQYTPGYGQKISWKKVKDLKKGDFISIFDGIDDGVEDTSKTDNLLQLVGFFIGDGSMRLSGIGYASYDRGGSVAFHAICDAKTPYENIVKEEFGKVAVQKGKGLYVYDKSVAELFNSLGLYEKCKDKILPEWIFKLSRRQKLLVLRGIVDSDGSIGKRGNINIRLNNKKLVEQIRHLAMQCGVRVSNLYYTSQNVSFNGYRYVSRNWGFQCQNVEKNREIGSNRIDNKKKLLALDTKRKRDYKGCKVNTFIAKTLRENGVALDTIVSIDSDVFDDVYDIEVEGFHNFIADGIFVHNSATVDGNNNDWSAIKKYHTSYRIDGDIVSEETFNHRQLTGSGRVFEKPWRDIGYHAGFEMDGGVYVFKIGRSWSMAGAHAGFPSNNYYNDNFLGLCTVGNFDKSAPPKGLWDLCVKAVREIRQHFGFGIDKVVGHREVYDLVHIPRQKTCPGNLWDLDAFRKEL